LSQSPYRIVVIEDNPADTVLLRHALDTYGVPFAMEILRDGEAALRYLREHCATGVPDPCLIVLDLHLPRYDGAAVLRAIREHSELAHVAVAVLTSSASPAERDEVLNLGVHLYRTKPIDWNQTVDLAGELLSLCKSAHGLAAHL
jgi:CheY-like chemotaxis protein